MVYSWLLHQCFTVISKSTSHWEITDMAPVLPQSDGYTTNICGWQMKQPVDSSLLSKARWWTPGSGKLKLASRFGTCQPPCSTWCFWTFLLMEKKKHGKLTCSKAGSTSHISSNVCEPHVDHRSFHLQRFKKTTTKANVWKSVYLPPKEHRWE